MKSLKFGFQSDKETLLSLARNSVIANLSGGKPCVGVYNSDWLNAKLGAFVTIRLKNGELRGCLGRFTSDIALHRLICELAVSAATRDFRFLPVKTFELENIIFEISVLSPLQRIFSLDELVPGKHGIYIKKGPKSGTFLPQVILETGWDIATFVGHCSRDKAGLGWDGWKDAELFRYTAEVFSEAF